MLHLNKTFYAINNVTSIIYFFITKTRSLTISPLKNQHPPSSQHNHRNQLIQLKLPARILVLQCLPKRLEE